MAADRNGRIQVVINGLSARRGGVETYLINLLHFMPDDSPIDVFLLAPEALPLPPERENFRKIHVNWPVENPFVRAAWESICLPGLIKDLHADLLFCPGGIIGARLPSGCRTVAMSRNMLPFDREQRRKYPPGYMRTRLWILRRILLRDMLRADLVIFISEFARNAIQSCAQRRLANTVVIPHGISPEFRNGGSPELPRPNCLPAGEYLLYVSDLSFYKSQVEVVQAYALLKQHRHTPEKLVLAGYETKDYGRLVRSEIHRLGLESDVIVTGRIPYDEMPALYHHARLNIFASECENCPNILLEALASGRPLVTSSRPPMPEFAGDAAIYFDPRSPAELADRLSGLLADPSRMQEFSAKARERSLLYDWPRTAAATWNLIEESARQRSWPSL
jgi:glycosyltransferase involved in cell wall biosynthesis